MRPPYILGISGGSGSGKTFLVRALMHQFRENEICFISQDNYYKAKNLVPKDVNGIENFDTLEALDFERFYTDILRLKEGNSVEMLEYTYNQPEKIPQRLFLKPAPVILVEGIFLFANKKVFDLLDLRIFVEASDVIKIKRRVLRDFQERGYEFDDVFYRYENHVGPAYEKYIVPYINQADFVVPNFGNPQKAVEVIAAFLKSKVERSNE